MARQRARRRGILDPLIHFLAIGAVLWLGLRIGVEHGSPGDGERATTPARTQLPIPPEAVASLGAALERQLRRPPTRDEWEHAVRAHAEEEMLVREALALGLAEGDAVIALRLARNRSFVEDERATRDADLARAMLARDPVVRRRLVQRLRFALESAADAEPAPPDAEAFAVRAEARGRPMRHRFAHILFARDSRGTRAAADAAAARAVLSPEALRTPSLPAGGDPSLAPAEQPAQSAAAAARIFGPAFAEALPGLPVGAWAGPVPSSLGAHLVYVHERLPAEPASAATVAAALGAEARARRRREAFESALAALRERYVLVYALPTSSP